MVVGANVTMPLRFRRFLAAKLLLSLRSACWTSPPSATLSYRIMAPCRGSVRCYPIWCSDIRF
jgi:hypothetical protein